MKKVILIIGLPGSGKTHLGEEHAATGGVFLDDLSMVGGLEKLEANLHHDLIIIADVFLCQPNARTAALAWLAKHIPEHTVEMIFFANDKEKCYTNVRRRTEAGDTRAVDNMIEYMSKYYEIPEGVEIKEVYVQKPP